MDKRNSFKDGYMTGKTWNENYRPGGPYRCTDRIRYPATVERDAAESKAWFEGFDEGLNYQKVFKRLSNAS